MIHRASARFWQLYEALPADVRDLADKGFALLKADSAHPSLHFKPVGRFWSARVGIHYRALSYREDEVITWVWIGHHSEYDQLLASRR